MKTRILYNQGEQSGGGGAPPSSPSPSSPSGGAAAAPAASSGGAPASSNSQGDNPFTRFQAQLATLQRGNSQPSQPGANGSKQGESSANEAQGEAGENNTNDQDTTAQGQGDSTEATGKGVQDNQWSEDELKALKDHGLEDMPFHPSARKFMQSNRELRARFDQVSASNANAITDSEAIRQAAYAAASGDPKQLQELLGVDFKLNTRTVDDQIKEIEGFHGEQLNILQKAITMFEGRGQMDVAQALLDVGNQVLGTWNQRAGVLQQEKQWQEREKSIMAKVGKAPEPQNQYKHLSAKAKENLAALTAEDPQSAQYFTAIEEMTKAGGPLRAIGVDLAKAFGSNLATARQMLEFGKALHVLKNQPQILNDARKKWESDYERKKALGGTNGKTTGGSAGGRATTDAVINNLAGQMKAFMGQANR